MRRNDERRFDEWVTLGISKLNVQVLYCPHQFGITIGHVAEDGDPHAEERGEDMT